MSNSSLYSPEEDDDEASGTEDLEPESLQSTFPVSSPRLQELALSSADENKDPPSRSLSLSRGSKRIRLRSRANAWRALKKLQIGGYRELYAETFDDILQGSTYYIGGNLPSTQNGATTWTSQEKDCFFNALARVGKTRCQDIAAAIGSKSEMEVRAYMQLLHRGLEQQHVVESNTGATILGDMPAALEIGEECREALDQASEVISMEEQRSERVAAKRRHGNMSLIDSDMAETVEEKLEYEADEEQVKSEMDITASLFNFSNWIKTSERIFMNFGEPRIEDNWMNIRFEDESPSITSDAFLDFHALATSLTRRLVQSSIFFAMSRIRAMESGSSHPIRMVRSRDVIAALNVLRMKPNAGTFWAGVARRCSLNVIDEKREKGWKTVPLGYDQVEEKLLDHSFGSRASSHANANSTLPSVEPEDQTKYSDVMDDSSSVEALDSPSPTATSSSDEDFSDREEAHASALDKQASSSEDRRLWQILQSTASQPISPEPDVKRTNNKLDVAVPFGKRKAKQDIVDWRDRIRYRSEWEEFGHDTPAIKEEFVESQRKRRRTDSQPPSEKVISSIETDTQFDSAVAPVEGDESMADESDHAAEGNTYSDRMDVDIPSANDRGLTDDSSSENSSSY